MRLSRSSRFILSILPLLTTTAPAIEGFTRPDLLQDPLYTPPAQLRSTESAPAPLNASEPSVPFSITVNYSGDAGFEQAFADAAATWQSLIPYYLDGTQSGLNFPGLTIDAVVEPNDGPGGILGSAGPTSYGFDDSGFALATEGFMTFDSDDFSESSETFERTVLHEMAHVIGIGTLWFENDVYDSSAPSVTDPVTGESVGQYTGAGGLAGWQSEFDPGATYVPVEKEGGTGTADGHWNEGLGGGTTGYVSSITGQDANTTLMTGWLNDDSYISNATLGSMEDIGYSTTLSPIPEPSTSLLGLAGASLLILRRRRA